MVIASFRYTVNKGAAAAAPQVNVGEECQRVRVKPNLLPSPVGLVMARTSPDKPELTSLVIVTADIPSNTLVLSEKPKEGNISLVILMCS